MLRKTLFLGSAIAFSLLLPNSSLAETPSIPTPSDTPLEIELLAQNFPLLAERKVLTSTTIAAKGLTIPSLWWTDEQFGGKLLQDWLAYQSEGRVDLVVNRQLWTLLDYIGRYRFTNNFGTVAREYGYNSRIFNQQGILLASYTCNFKVAQCKIAIESAAQNTLRSR